MSNTSETRLLNVYATDALLSLLWAVCFNVFTPCNDMCTSPPPPAVLPSEVDMSSPLMYGTPSSRVDGTPRSGARGTPARQRPDLGSVRKSKQVDLQSEPVSALGRRWCCKQNAGFKTTNLFYWW